MVCMLRKWQKVTQLGIPTPEINSYLGVEEKGR